MFARCSRLTGFKNDERGTIAVVFALVIGILVLVTGLAIDVGRAVHANTKLTAALDAASLAAAKGLRLEGLTDAQVEALALKFFDTNMKLTGGNYAVINSLRVHIDRAKSAVLLDVDADVPTLFGGLAGVEKIRLPKESVAIFDAKDIEVAVQLDVTGSMGGRKILDLKSATKELVDILIPDEPTGQKVRIALAPYSAGVNAGAFAASVNGGASSSSTCVYERKTNAAEFTDDLPFGLDALMAKEELPPPPRRTSIQNCPDAEILPMTEDKVQLKNTVDTYNPQSSTAGQLGTAWAWYLLSPKWAGIWPTESEPTPYRDGKTIKVAVVMTDGIYNTINGVNWGDTSREAIEAGDKAIQLCQNMRNAGIAIYTVGFELRGAAQPTRIMRECASTTANFFNAENGEQLRLAFQSIAEQIVSLRLSR